MDHKVKRLFAHFSHNLLYLLLISCLALPLLAAALFIILHGFHLSSVIFLFTASLGSTGAWFLLPFWEKKMQAAVNQLVALRIKAMQNKGLQNEEETHCLQHEIVQLKLEREKKCEEMRIAYLEFEDLRQEYRRLIEESGQLQSDLQKKLDHKDLLIAEYQRTIVEQRAIIGKKAGAITKLEEKNSLLTQEIRSLIQVEGCHAKSVTTFAPESFDSYVVSNKLSDQTPDYSWQLKKYIEKAENLPSVGHLGYLDGKSPRFLDLSLDGYTLDRRWLFESFKEEGEGAPFIYDPEGKKFLFLNPSIKALTGFNSEKFMNEYPRLIKKYSEWEEGISKLKALNRTRLKLSISQKSGSSKALDCYMGLLHKGPFAHHVIGLFSQSPN